MKFVWPPLMKALDERAKKIANGLAAADRASRQWLPPKSASQAELAGARDEGHKRIADAEKRAQLIVEEIKANAQRRSRPHRRRRPRPTPSSK